MVIVFLFEKRIRSVIQTYEMAEHISGFDLYVVNGLYLKIKNKTLLYFDLL